MEWALSVDTRLALQRTALSARTVPVRVVEAAAQALVLFEMQGEFAVPVGDASDVGTPTAVDPDAVPTPTAADVLGASAVAFGNAGAHVGVIDDANPKAAKGAVQLRMGTLVIDGVKAPLDKPIAVLAPAALRRDSAAGDRRHREEETAERADADAVSGVVAPPVAIPNLHDTRWGFLHSAAAPSLGAGALEGASSDDVTALAALTSVWAASMLQSSSSVEGVCLTAHHPRGVGGLTSTSEAATPLTVVPRRRAGATSDAEYEAVGIIRTRYLFKAKPVRTLTKKK
jgi:hypothetical protein